MSMKQGWIGVVAGGAIAIIALAKSQGTKDEVPPAASAKARPDVVVMIHTCDTGATALPATLDADLRAVDRELVNLSTDAAATRGRAAKLVHDNVLGAIDHVIDTCGRARAAGQQLAAGAAKPDTEIDAGLRSIEAHLARLPKIRQVAGELETALVSESPPDDLKPKLEALTKALR